MEKFQFVAVRTAFHGGGAISWHRSLAAAEKSAKQYKGNGCACGCAGVVTAEEYAKLPSKDETFSTYALCR